MKKDTTKKVHDWMKGLDDSLKINFAINWRIPHTLFNVACKIYPHDKEDLQGVNWFQIYESRDLGRWSNKTKAIV